MPSPKDGWGHIKSALGETGNKHAPCPTLAPKVIGMACEDGSLRVRKDAYITTEDVQRRI